jgi:hypothetical protein
MNILLASVSIVAIVYLVMFATIVVKESFNYLKNC